MKCKFFVMYALYSVLPRFNVQLGKANIYNRPSLMRFLSVEYEESDSDVQELEQVALSKTGGMVSRSELLAL